MRNLTEHSAADRLEIKSVLAVFECYLRIWLLYVLSALRGKGRLAVCVKEEPICKVHLGLRFSLSYIGTN